MTKLNQARLKGPCQEHGTRSDSRIRPKRRPSTGRAESLEHPLSRLCAGCKPAPDPDEYLEGMLQSEKRDFLLSKEKQTGQSGTAVIDTLCLCIIIASLVFLGLKLNTNTDLNSFPACHPSNESGTLGSSSAGRQRLSALSIPQAAAKRSSGDPCVAPVPSAGQNNPSTLWALDSAQGRAGCESCTSPSQHRISAPYTRLSPTSPTAFFLFWLSACV